MKNRFNLVELAHNQKTERYKAMLILGNIYSLSPGIGSAIADALKANCISIVDEFVRNKSLGENVDTFGAEDLKQLLREMVRPSEEVVVVEGIDMLWSIWSTFERNRFLRMLEMDTISPYKETVFLFLCLKDDQLIKCDWLNDALRTPRVLDINDIVMGGHR